MEVKICDNCPMALLDGVAIGGCFFNYEQLLNILSYDDDLHWYSTECQFRQTMFDTGDINCVEEVETDIVDDEDILKASDLFF